ncbi:hypothetical protein [Undibacterium terreum]|uniref:hypothetical protein n=1 Tax=Undibacterium terreum TaxID=1224302 RepID=UPI001664BA18|nr:hypothetical protein [Undibacterium terreum]
MKKIFSFKKTGSESVDKNITAERRTENEEKFKQADTQLESKTSESLRSGMIWAQKFESLTPEQRAAYEKRSAQFSANMKTMRETLASTFATLNSSMVAAMRSANEPSRLSMRALDLYDALKARDHIAEAEIMGSPDFGAHLLRLVVYWAEMTEEERAEAVTDEMAKVVERMEKVDNGYLLRQDQIDKKTMITYFNKKNHVIRNRAELESWPFEDWPLERNYGPDTLVKWYKEAMPHVRLVGGRPRKITLSDD